MSSTPSRGRASGVSGLLCNIGTGVETSVNDLYGAMARNAGVNQPAIYVPARPGELQRSSLDPSRASMHLAGSRGRP